MSSLSNLDLPSIEAALALRKAILESEIQAKLSEIRDDHIGFDSANAIDGGDAATIDESDQVRVAEARRDAEELQDIERALQRIESGRFGACVECGIYIGNERLRIKPTASRCISCQKLAEVK